MTFLWETSHHPQKPHLSGAVTALEGKGGRKRTQVHRAGPAMMLFGVRAKKGPRLSATFLFWAPACGCSKGRPTWESKRNDQCPGDVARIDLRSERREARAWYRFRKAEVPRARKYPFTKGPLSRTLDYHPGVPRLRSKVLTPGATF